MCCNENTMTKARQDFVEAQQRTLDRYGVEAEAVFVDAPSTGGRAHALIAGEGPPVVMLNGIGTPAAMFAPLMARLDGFRMFAVDLPGYGLTDTHERLAENLRDNAVRFLDEALEGLGLERPTVVANSLGSLWASWRTLLSTLNALLKLNGNRPEMRLTAEQLARIEQRSMIFWGRDDPFGSPEVGECVVQAMPAAELHVVGGGHAPWLTQAEHIGPVAARFLREEP